MNGANKKSEAELNQLCQAFLFNLQFIKHDPNIKPVRWPGHQGFNEHEDSGCKIWKDTHWSQFAYAQYVTNLPYLCNSIMLSESLHRLGCKPDRLMMYPSGSFSLENDSTEARLLRKARDEYRVNLKPIEIQRRTSHDRKLLEE